MSDQLFTIVITAAMLVTAVAIVLAQHAPARLWYAWRAKFDPDALLNRSGQIGVLTIAAGIGHAFLNDGGAGETAMMSTIGVALIVIGSVKTGATS